MTYKQKLDKLPHPLREDMKYQLSKGYVCAAIREVLRLKGYIRSDTPIIEWKILHNPSINDSAYEEISFTMTLSDCIDYLEEAE